MSLAADAGKLIVVQTNLLISFYTGFLALLLAMKRISDSMAHREPTFLYFQKFPTIFQQLCKNAQKINSGCFTS